LKKSRLASHVVLSGALLGLAAFSQAQAQGTAYPNRPLRLLIPYTAGMVDTFARGVAQHLSERLGQPVVPDNRPGASQAIALEAAAKAAPDGYTLIMGTQAGLVFTTAARKSLPYDPLREIASITTLFATQNLLVVHPSVPARSVLELIALAKSQPGKLNYATIGIASGQHLSMELFKGRTGTDLVHVPYKGSAPAMADLLAGQVQVMFAGDSTLPHIRSGKLRALASSGLQRTQAMPDLPTVSEAGVPGFDFSTWFGLSTTGGAPRPIIERLNREALEMLRLPATREKSAALNLDLIPSTPEQMSERVRTEIPAWTKVMRAAGIEPE